MAYWAYVQLELVRRPMTPRDLALLERALLVYDTDAPVADNWRRDVEYEPLGAWGYEGVWRAPVLSVVEVLSLIRALGYDAVGRAIASVVYNDYSGTPEDDQRNVEAARWRATWDAPDDRLGWVVARYDRRPARAAHFRYVTVARERAALARVSRRFARVLPPLPEPPLPVGSRGSRRRAKHKSTTPRKTSKR